MLTISKALSSGQAQKYHKLEFTSKSQSYYQQGDDVKGEWQGKLAASLGLKGDVAPLEFSRLADGIHPQTEEQMVRHRVAMEYKNPDGTTTKAVEHRAGWDATFSAPKSVSLTALVGGDDRVREAHRAAVSTALDELERYTQARIGGNNPAETTGKFIAAKFEHDTARPVDGYAAPQLHTHAVIFNVTERADGSTRALQERGFFETQQYATAVYQSSLTYQLRSLGYDIETGRSGAPEIRGYSQEYLDASSPRSQQIKDQMRKSGYSGPEAAEIAAHSTRGKKQFLTSGEVLAAHKEMATNFGDQPQQVVAAARVRAEQRDRRPEASTRAKEAVTFARDSIFEREAVADERTILRDALRRGVGEASYRDIRAEFDRRQEDGQFRSAQGKKHSSGRSFTTPETIAAERANIRYVLEGRNAVEPMMSAERAREKAGTRSFLNDSQRRVIEEVLNSADRIHGLQGLAGTGKTTTLQSIREGAEASGYKVEGFAPTSKAARQLREAGIDATTLQSFLARGHNHPSADPANRHLYMLDESSLASTQQMRSFLDKLNPNDRVLVIGDIRQHQGVDAGRPFQQMQEAGMQTSQLDKIMRQKDPELLRVVEHFSRNETALGVGLLQQQGRVMEIPDNAQRIEAIAKDYAAKPESTLVVSPDNASRREINDAIRHELKASGAVSQDDHRIEVLTQRSDLTSVDRTWAAKYQPGDVLYYTRGSKEQVIEPRSYATVVSVDAAANRITVVKEGGIQVAYNPERLRGITAYREISRDFAERDRIQFTATNQELGVSNRDLGAIQRIDGNQIDVKMDGEKERTVSFDSAKMRHFDHGYTVTSHSSQGLTTDRVLVNMDTTVHPELINTRFAYVSVSRASQDARIYTNDAGSLGERLSTDVTKTSAIDLQKAPVERTANQQTQTKEPPITNSREHPHDDPRRGPSTDAMVSLPEIIRREAEVDTRRYAPLEAAMHNDTAGYEWKHETGEIESYKHNQTGGWLHIDPATNFYDREAQQVSRESALEHAAHEPSHSVAENAVVGSNSNGDINNNQGISL
jgi:conjugative relaxase-like TrwC/TraI family protein